MIYTFTCYQQASYGDERRQCLYCIDGKVHVDCYHGFTENHWKKVGKCDGFSCKVHKNLSTKKEEPIDPRHIAQVDPTKLDSWDALQEFLSKLNL